METEMEVSDSSDEVLHISRTTKSRSKIFSSSSSEDNEYLEEDNEWQEIRNGSAVINEYSEEEKLLVEGTDCNSPYDLYKLFFTDNILNMIVEETNTYAAQSINDSSYKNRLHQLEWKPVTKEEMNTFIGILLIMDVNQVPEIRFYWSKKDIYKNELVKRSIKRDRLSINPEIFAFFQQRYGKNSGSLEQN